MKDSESRAAYDRQMAASRNGAEVAIWQDVDLEDFSIASADRETDGGTLSFPCRCGGAYVICPADLNPEASSAVVSCDTCSLAVRVLYTVV